MEPNQVPPPDCYFGQLHGDHIVDCRTCTHDQPCMVDDEDEDE